MPRIIFKKEHRMDGVYVRAGIPVMVTDGFVESLRAAGTPFETEYVREERKEKVEAKIISQTITKVSNE